MSFVTVVLNLLSKYAYSHVGNLDRWFQLFLSIVCGGRFQLFNSAAKPNQLFNFRRQTAPIVKQPFLQQ